MKPQNKWFSVAFFFFQNAAKVIKRDHGIGKQHLISTEIHLMFHIFLMIAQVSRLYKWNTCWLVKFNINIKMGDLQSDLFAVQYFLHKFCQGQSTTGRGETTRTQQMGNTPWKRTGARQLVPTHLATLISPYLTGDTLRIHWKYFAKNGYFYTWYIIDILYLLSQFSVSRQERRCKMQKILSDAFTEN